MQEFVYYNPNQLDFPLHESIKTISSLNQIENNNFIVSNSDEISSEICAKEIDFYMKNSQDSYANKITNTTKLYEISAVKFDYAQDVSLNQEIKNSLLIISDSKEDYENFIEKLDKEKFDLMYLNEPEKLKEIKGSFGDFQLSILHNDKTTPLEVAQIVWFNATLEKQRTGIYDPNQSSIEEVILTVTQNLEGYTYKKFTTYDSSICQYHERREEICSRCVTVCPTNAITKIDSIKHLEFSPIDCIGCGTCVSVCPSGSLDYAPTSKEALMEMSRFYKGVHPLILSQKTNWEMEISLKENILPFAIEGENIFDEASLLSLVQMSASQVIYYAPNLIEITKEAIEMINTIFRIKYQKEAILIAQNEIELQEQINNVVLIPESYFNINQTGMKKREIFAQRLEHIVGDENLGTMNTGEHIHYGKVVVNEANCTLCLSCVGACNVDAIVANEKDLSLRINPSLCTACGYCEVSCPEKDCLTIERDVIELEPLWFKENILAKDTLFACVECGKEFATAKAVEKIATMMAPIFAKSSEAKRKTLYCCENCKVKIMFKEGFLNA